MEYEMMLRILLAALFGGTIGYLREIEKKAAGLRTHTLVCVGSALFTVVSIYVSQMYDGADPGRIAASVATGIGFIGAGTIFQAGDSVRGLTTAASIWMCAALGLAVGFGLYSVSVFSTLLALAIIQVLHYYEKKYLRIKEKQGEE